MDQIAAMRTFIKVVECQSFTKAANQLGISVAMTSKLMQQLEESLSTRLLSRTTRQVNPTEAGQFYYQRSQALLWLSSPWATSTGNPRLGPASNMLPPTLIVRKISRTHCSRLAW